MTSSEYRADAEPAVPGDNTTPPQAGSGTVEARISAAIGELDALDTRPLSEHAPVYESLHDHLQSVLGEIDGA